MSFLYYYYGKQLMGKTIFPMRLFLVMSIMITPVKHIRAQSTVAFDAGQMFSTYKYTDSLGEIKDFTKNITGCYSLSYHYINPNGLFIRTGFGMRKGGASYEYDGVKIDWNTQYADASLGLGYMLNRGKVKPYLIPSFYFAYLLKGEETLGQNTYDIKNNKSMSDTDYGLYITPGIKVTLSNFISFYAEYKTLLGLKNLEVSTNQKSYNRGFSINLGIAIAIIRYNYVTSK